MQTAIEVFGDKEVAAQFEELGRQLPFAQSTTLNGLANATQAKVQDGLPSRFNLRRAEFIRRTVYRKPGEDFATKSRLEAGVRINPERDFLAKFEEGGEKTSRNGGRVAVPVDVRRNKNDIVSKANRPRVLLTKPKVALLRDVIVQRVGRGRKAATRLLYVLKKSVRIPQRLGMAETARSVADTQTDAIAGAAIDKALRTAR